MNVQIDHQTMLKLINVAYPEWTGFSDARFVRDEIDYKHKAVAKANDLIGQEVFQQMLEAEDFDGIVTNLRRVASSTNLLYLSQPKTSDISILEADNLDKPSFCRAMFDLLWGEGDPEDRLGRYIDYVKQNSLPNKWTFPTYFLFLTHPKSEMFVKPMTTAWFLRYTGVMDQLPTRPAPEVYGEIRKLSRALSEAFSEYQPTDLMDIQSLIWVCYSRRKQLENFRLALPFSDVFEDREDTAWGLDLLAEIAAMLGVKSAEDERLSVGFRRRGKDIRLNFCHWLIAAFLERGGEKLVELALIRADVPELAAFASPGFAQRDDEPGISMYRLPLEFVRSAMNEGLSEALARSMAHIKARFAGYIRSPFRNSNHADLAHLLFDNEARARAFTEGMSLDPKPTSIWWVNQNITLESEITGGFVWAPFSGRRGQVVWHWDTLKDVREGDIILHAANRQICYVSQVVDGPVEERRPGSSSEDIGRLVSVESDELVPPVPFAYFNREIVELNIPKGPLNASGNANQGYFFHFTTEALSKIVQAAPSTNWPDYVQALVNVEPPEPYRMEQFLTETGMEQETAERWLRAIRRKGQAIFYGPPGTGKTYVAQRLAKLLIGEGEGFTELVQFHPSYSYEDFVQGIRPLSRDDGSLSYPVVAGRFLDFCRRAAEVKDPCVLIIDEINRANLAQVFGELMYLLEYRGERVPLAAGELFSIPENVYIIGTMNTADRSIALVDHALRRRFAFLRLAPQYHVLSRKHAANPGINVSGLVGVLRELNGRIDDPHYEVGISFFMGDDVHAHLEDIWRMEIEPYLDEYFVDQADTAKLFDWDKIKTRVQP